MALQQFVQKSAQNGPKAMLENSAVPTKHAAPIFSRGSSMQSQAAQVSATEKPTESKPVEEFMARNPVTLNQQDRDVLSSLAAVQIRYNRPAEAVPYLMMLRKTDPSDVQSARLLALALMKLGNWEQAESILDEVGEGNGADEADTGILSFYRGLVAFKQKKLNIARQWLQRFRSLVNGGAA